MSSRISERPLPLIDRSTETVDMNLLLQAALQNLKSADGRMQIIVRCEKLPVVEIHRAALEWVIHQLLDVIAGSASGRTRSYLYLLCQELNKDVAPELTKGLKRYNIQFYTNLETSAAWLARHEHLFNVCRQLLQGFQASLTVYEVKQSGCLFSISLLGKL